MSVTRRRSPIRPRRVTARHALAQAAAAGAWLCAAVVAPAQAQDAWPSRPISLISPYSVGGDADMAARNLATAAQKVLGQTVVVQNKPGASGVIGSAFVLNAEANGYTLLLARTGSQSILPAIKPKNTKYRWDDYTFIGTLELNPYGCMVNAKSPYKTFADFAKGLKEKGKAMNFATAGNLTTNDMGPRQLFSLLKLGDQAPTQVPYKGSGDATASLVASETDFACASIGAFLPLINSGALRALFVTTPERIPSLPDVPTAREIGVPEMEKIIGWSALMGPANLPAAVTERLTEMLQVVAKDEGWQQATKRAGSIPYVKSPEETRAFMKAQFDMYRALGESLNLIDKP
ncbi:MAG: tripartite tricarboxylate transporter substrate binding protein [Lautropia sp.]